jgi:hypothetical protein
MNDESTPKGAHESATTDPIVCAGTDSAGIPSDSAASRPSTVKRARRTNRQLSDLDDVILEVLLDEHPATLRGTFYRVMSAGAVEKSEAGYRMVGRQVLKLRRAGVLPYSWITDGTRYILKPNSWTELDEMLEDAAASYRRMLWRDQAINVQLFTEKDAITGVISGVTQHRMALMRLLKALDLPSEDEHPESSTSADARKAANARWDMERRRRGTA